MKERPILFSAPMVRAILDGRKTVTRRIYKPRESSPHEIMDELDDGAPWPHWFNPRHGPEHHPLSCPYGQPGDRLWVKETWATPPYLDATKPRDMPNDARIYYVADGELGRGRGRGRGLGNL